MASATHAEDRAVIDEMVRRIVDRFDPEKVILFGSRARGTAGPDSDADLLVVLRNPGSRRRKWLEIRAALHGVGLAKDIVVVTPEEVERDRKLVGTVVRPAVQEGEVPYERISEQEQLTDHAIAGRYPGDWEPLTRTEADEAVGLARRVRASVRTHLRPEVLG